MINFSNRAKTIYSCLVKLNSSVAKFFHLIMSTYNYTRYGSPRAVYLNFKGYVPGQKLGGELIRASEKMQYLGVVFDFRFSFCRHIRLYPGKAKMIYCGYHWLLRMRGGLLWELRLLIYKQVVRTVIT